MAKEFAKSFYNSKAWKRCRDSFIQERLRIDGGVCMECHEEQGYIVHHKITLTEDNIHDADIALNYRNMMYVCKACHDQYEGHGVGHARTKALCIFDDNGQPISMRDIDSPRQRPW